MSRFDCMTTEEYELWRAGTRSRIPCFDCPASFEREALAAGRCNRPAAPNLGYRTEAERKAARRAAWRAYYDRNQEARRAYTRANKKRTSVRNGRADASDFSYDSRAGTSSESNSIAPTPCQSLVPVGAASSRSDGRD